MNGKYRRDRKSSSARRITLLLAFVILSALSTLWALASPLMSVPDEPAHAVKAASVVRGELLGESEGGQGDVAMVQVPGYMADLAEQTCYAFQSTVTADCAPAINGDDVELTDAGTSAGNYNPMYYYMVGWPSLLLSGAPALYAMRIISGLAGAMFLAVSLRAATQLAHLRWPVAATTVTLTPMVLFLNGSINPNALEIVTSAALFLNLCVVLENAASLRSVRSNIVLVGISGAVLANTRSLSLVWLAMAVLVPLIIYGMRPLLAVMKNRLGLGMTALIGVGSAAGLLWVLHADSFKSLTGKPTGITRGDAALIMLDRTFDYVTGYIGRMGWLDAPLPIGVYIFWHFLMGAVFLMGISAPRLRERVAVTVLVAAAVLLPPILQAQVIEELGWIWQGRYLLALIVILLLTCGVAFREVSFPAGAVARRAGAALLAGVAAAHLYAFLYVLRRYTVGIKETVRWEGMFADVWQPPFTWQVLAVFYLLVLTAGAMLIYRTLFPSVAPEQPAAGTADAVPGQGSAVAYRPGPDAGVTEAGVIAGNGAVASGRGRRRRDMA